MSADANRAKRRGSFARELAIVLSINLASALAVVLLSWLMVSRMSRSQLVTGLIISLVFANCCGTLMALTLPRVAPRFARRQFPLNWIFFLSTLLVLSAIGSLLAVLILTRIEILPRQHFWAIYRSSLVLALVIALIIGVSRYFYEGLKHRLEVTTRKLQLKELDEERARKLAIEARLSSLESRIHPHFLFNTLNSISSLIQEDPQLAERLVERLAALLRFSLDSNQTGTVPLGRELKIVIDYLEIEKARFGDKLRYSIDVPAELEAVDVPPLAVQTLVENSLKHAISRRRDGGEVRVSARAAGQQVIIEVQDNGPGFQENSVLSGHGLDNLKARLTALFADGASLEVLTRGEQTVVAVSLPSKQRQAVSIV